jgi:hypothetical protein
MPHPGQFSQTHGIGTVSTLRIPESFLVPHFPSFTPLGVFRAKGAQE